MGRLAFILILACAASAHAAIHYIAVTGTGDESGDDRSNLMPAATFRDTHSAGDDEGWCQPGDYTGLLFNKLGGTNPGSSWLHPIRYKADPVTCTPRSADWFTRETCLEEPNPAIHAVFGQVEFRYNTAPATGLNDYFIILDGLWIRDLYCNIECSAILLENCNIMSVHGDRASNSTDYSVYFRYYASGTRYADITLRDCYIRPGEHGIYNNGSWIGALNIDHCKVWGASSTTYEHAPTLSDAVNMTTITDSDFSVLDGVAADTAAKDTLTITAVDPVEPKRIMTLSGDSTYPPPMLFAIIYDVSGGTSEVQPIVDGVNFNHSTYVLTLDTELSFTPEPAVDTVDICDCTHGAGIALRADNLCVRRTAIHGHGSTRLMYTYKLGTGINNLTVTDSLFYGGLNTYGVDLSGNEGIGDDLTFTNNTLGGRRDAGNYEVGHWPTWRYGHALSFGIGTGANVGTWVISNNVVAGRWDGDNITGAVLTCNWAYYNGSGTTLNTGMPGDPDNWGNKIIYAGEPYGSEPDDFASTGGNFLATDPDFDSCYTAAWLTSYAHNLNSSFHIPATSAFIDQGDSSHRSATDIDGDPRNGLTDIGCDEWPEIIKYLLGYK